ncbi:MAG: family 16 glycosylhydrolase, partial [Gammaproteobacteria bacterium]|nr:family 16 glycosylhydrolase [Gammaproteobacteria bacterium]
PTLTSVNIASSNNAAELATTGDVITVTLTADEPIMQPIVTINGVAADSVSGGGANWVASRTITAGESDGAVSFAIEFSDLAGNAGTPVTAPTDGSSVTLDVTAPTLLITGAPVDFTTLDPITLTFQFSEPVSGFALSDIMRTGGTASAFASVNSSTYTASFTPNGTADLTVAVMAGVAADLAGNANEAAAGVSITNNLDADAPLLTSVSISSSNASSGFARTGDVVTVDMQANEAILEPVVTIGGIAADSVTGSGSDWQASRTMLSSDAEGEISFAINFQDEGGNAGPQTTATTDDSAVIFDITAPTLAIEGLPATIQTLDPVTVTFQFDEDVSGFALGDISVTNGSADSFVSTDAATYTADITAVAAGSLTVTVNADAATDLAGNGNVSAEASATVDLTPFWQQVWSDEFTGTMLNASNWTVRTDADCPDPCNGEQSYAAGQVSVGAGLLTITTIEDTPNYISGLIDTRGNRELHFGRVEIDVKLPLGTTGVKPSLQLLPATDEYGPWPQSGAIDVTNAPGFGGTLEHSLNYGLPEPEDTEATATSPAPVNADVNFFTYALEWEGGELRWFVDGTHVATQIDDNWYTYAENADGVYSVGAGAAPFDQDFYLVLSQMVTASGGTYPQIMQVEAVRVYQCTNAVDPNAGTGCAGSIDAIDPGVTPVVATSPPYNDMPFTESLEVYTDGAATLLFEDSEGSTTAGTLVAETFSDAGVVVTSNLSGPDNGNTVWSIDINANAGTGGVLMGPADLSPASTSFDLTGGATAGEVLFRMRVNSASSDPQLAVGLDSELGSGSHALSFIADGQWNDYSVKIGDLVSDSVMQGTSLDLASLTNLFRIEVSGGTVNLDLDDVSVKVACRDVGNCEATARQTTAPPEELYVQAFDSMDINDTAALTNDGWIVFGNVFDSNENFQFGYGPFGAPNGPPGEAFFSAIVADQGGPDQGTQQLSIFSDYNCCGTVGHFNGTDIVESLVFQERTITADDVGRTFTFSWDAKADTSVN